MLTSVTEIAVGAASHKTTVLHMSQDIITPTASPKSVHDSFEIFYRQRRTNLCTRQALVSMRDMTVCWCLRACAACWGSSGPTALPSRTCSPGRRLITSALSHADTIEYDAAQQTRAMNQSIQTAGPDNRYAGMSDRLLTAVGMADGNSLQFDQHRRVN